MSKRRALALVLLAVVVLLTVWFSTLSSEAREAIVDVLFGR